MNESPIGDVAAPDAGLGRQGVHGSLQSTGSAPCWASRSLTWLNGRDPKNPDRADSGEGWALSTHGMPSEPAPQRTGVASPEDRDEWTAAGDEGVDGAVGDLLPALAPVARGGARAHGEDAVEEQHAALGPRREVAGRRRGHAEVALQLGVDVDQAAGEGAHVGGDGEAQADGVPGGRVGVLPDDEHPHVVERLLEGPQDVCPARQVAATCRDLGAQELAEARSARPPPGPGPAPTRGGRARRGGGWSRSSTVDPPGEGVDNLQPSGCRLVP